MKSAICALFIFASAHAAETTPVVATESPAEMINKATCTKGSETRELEITARGDGHTVTYTKGGATKDVGSCSMKKEKCQAVFDGLKANLEKAGFVCKI